MPENVTAIRKDGMWKHNQHSLEFCTICAFEVTPVLYLKGLRNSENVDWIFYPKKEERETIYYGYKNSIISQKNMSWTIEERISLRRISSIPFLEDHNLEYPIGRLEWSFNAEKHNLTFSTCGPGREFTCGNGKCIPLNKRCDYNADCEDMSDEEDCKLYQLLSTYNKDNSPINVVSEQRGKVTDVGIFFDILSVNKILLDQSKIYVSYSLTFSWRENRVSYFNVINRISNESDKVMLPEASLLEIWNPIQVLGHMLADIGSVTNDESSMRLKLKMENLPEKVNPEESFENLVYKGTGGVLQQKMSMKGVYECYYDLFRFPFDRQECNINLQLKKHQDTRFSIDALNSSVTFSGNKQLTEIEITDYYFNLSENEEGIVFGFSISFKTLYQKQLTSLYFQLVLLWIVAYLTLYINVNDFNNRFMGAVTALLVMSTLMDNINNRLPASPQVRLIDIWNIWYVSQIIVIIVFHIFVNGLFNTKYIRPNSWQQPNNLNSIAKAVFPILNLTFTVYYICHNILYTEKVFKTTKNI